MGRVSWIIKVVHFLYRRMFPLGFLYVLYDEHLSSEFIHSKLNGTLLRFLLCLLRLKTSTVDSSTVEVEGNGNTQVIILEAYILLFIVLVSASEPKYHMSKKHFNKGFI